MYKVKYYTTSEGKCPVKDFIESKKEKSQPKIFAYIAQLEQDDPQLPRPFADLLEDGIHELRIKIAEDKGGTNVRILYFFYDGNEIILTNGFMKTTDSVPKSEIKKQKNIAMIILKENLVDNIYKMNQEYLWTSEVTLKIN